MQTMYPSVSRLLPAIGIVLAGLGLGCPARAQAVIDEARQAGRTAQTFPAADEDYFTTWTAASR